MMTLPFTNTIGLKRAHHETGGPGDQTSRREQGGVQKGAPEKMVATDERGNRKEANAG